jgi:acid phosphatase
MFSKSVMLALNGYIVQSVALSVYPQPNATCSGSANVSLSWYPPAKYAVNNLMTVINGTGVYGFVFNSSQAPLDAYNWCNMPHTNVKTYVRPSAEYKLEYVEVIHRHHKRTPYASNTFPKEQYAWSCSDEGLFYGGQPLSPTGNLSASTYWNVYTSSTNPLAVSGFNGTCMFPQITRGGLDDSHAHGADLAAVYAGLLNFIPAGNYDPSAVSYRVTNNVITSQVASMLIPGMYPSLGHGSPTPLLIQPPSVDSLEPAYSCPSGSSIFSSYSTGSQNADWLAHLRASSGLYSKLDAISGVDPTDSGWHRNWDHYFDNLSARQCHAKPLPCAASDSTKCVTQIDADAVYRLGEYEYSYIYRDAPQSLQASVATYGIWLAELAAHLRSAAAGTTATTPPPSYGNNNNKSNNKDEPRYRHNVAHDGSISRLLSILQIEKMVWPGMGSEVVFELYSKKDDGCYYLRVLWGGRTLVSSHPAFGRWEMVPLGTFLAYVDGLVGSEAAKVPALCGR